MPYFRLKMTSYMQSNPQGRTVLLTEEPNKENGWVQVPVYALRKWLDTKNKMFWYPNGSEETAAEAMSNDVDKQDNWRYLKYAKIRFSHGNIIFFHPITPISSHFQFTSLCAIISDRLSVVRQWKKKHEYPYGSETSSESDNNRGEPVLKKIKPNRPTTAATKNNHERNALNVKKNKFTSCPFQAPASLTKKMKTLNAPQGTVSYESADISMPTDLTTKSQTARTMTPFLSSSIPSFPT